MIEASWELWALVASLCAIVSAATCWFYAREMTWYVIAANVLVTVASWWVVDQPQYHALMVLWGCLIPLLVAISLIDLKLQIIPDRLQTLGLTVAIMQLAAESGIVILERLLITVVTSAVLIVTMYLYQKFRQRPVLGWGDVKLFFWLGLIFGDRMLHIMLVASVLAGIGVLILLKRKKGANTVFAFAPYICSATIIVAVMELWL